MGESGGGGESSGVDDVDELRRDESDEKNDRWRFHMSMKFENTEVSSARLRSGCEVSREAMIGVRKC
jgi:hypothetical protein